MRSPGPLLVICLDFLHSSDIILLHHKLIKSIKHPDKWKAYIVLFSSKRKLVLVEGTQDNVQPGREGERREAGTYATTLAILSMSLIL